MKQETKDKLIYVLDNFSSEKELLGRVELLHDYFGMFKIGSKLFTGKGPQIIKKIKKKYNSSIFLDLKYRNIPKTIEDAAYETTNLGVKMFTVHTLGGVDMMRAAVKGRNKAQKERNSYSKIIGVTNLTSERVYFDEVVSRARSALTSGLDGVVCSRVEIEYLRKNLEDNNFDCICPGIRFNKKEQDDQLRTCTPMQAIVAGANYLIIGRDATYKAQSNDDIVSNVERIIECVEF